MIQFASLTTGNNDITIPESENTLEELNSYGTDLQETLKYYGITDNYKGLTENEARKILDILYRRRNESKQVISSESYGRSGRSLQKINKEGITFNLLFQTAYHGSSSDFEKFDLNYGLTG